MGVVSIGGLVVGMSAGGCSLAGRRDNVPCLAITAIFLYIILLGHGQNPILSNEPLDKLDVTSRLLVCCESRSEMCETM